MWANLTGAFVPGVHAVMESQACIRADRREQNETGRVGRAVAVRQSWEKVLLSMHTLALNISRLFRLVLEDPIIYLWSQGKPAREGQGVPFCTCWLHSVPRTRRRAMHVGRCQSCRVSVPRVRHSGWGSGPQCPPHPGPASKASPAPVTYSSQGHSGEQTGPLGG